MRDVIDEFRAALHGRNINPPDEIIADGYIHRCNAEGLRRAALEMLRAGLTDHDVAGVLRLDVAGVRRLVGEYQGCDE